MRLLTIFILISTILLAPASLSTPPVVAAATLTAEPTTLAATVAAGATTTTLTLTLRNSTTATQTQTLALYAAWSPPTSTLRLDTAVPESLRHVLLPPQTERIDPLLRDTFQRAPDSRVTFLVFLPDQPDLTPAYALSDWRERGAFVYQTLFDHAERSQQALRAWLTAQGLAFTPLWIVNALAVQGTNADLQALAARPEVALISANHVTQLEVPPAAPAAAAPADGTPTWNISKIGADRTWADFGIIGQGITVATIDSGVRYDHPALLPSYRGFSSTTQLDHTYNWFDPQGTALVPTDPLNHGTHVMGTMVGAGDSAASRPAVGVAPGARWIAAQGCNAGGYCIESDLIASAQWMLAPTDQQGQHPRPDLRPQVINNSWSEATGGLNWYAGYVAAWRAAGIFPVFAAGNYGNNRCATIVSPADYATSFAVGATDQSDNLASFSSRGPTLDGRLKPELSAPGVGILSTFATGTGAYGTLSGTSMAAPHLAAAAAMVMAANPALIGDYAGIAEALTTTAAPRPDTRCGAPAGVSNNVPNYVYGYGRLDVYAAVAHARVEVPWLTFPNLHPTLAPGATVTTTITLDARHVATPGTYTARILVHTADLTLAPLIIPVSLTVTDMPNLAGVQGRVTDATTGAPLHATITLPNGPQLTTHADGGFTLRLPTTTQATTLVAQASGYVSRTLPLTLTAGTTTTLAFRLEAGHPQLTLPATGISTILGFAHSATPTLTLSNTGTLALDYTITTGKENVGIWRSDEAGGPSPTWITPPATATRLMIGDDGSSSSLPLGFDFPFYGQYYHTLALNANGWLSFEALPSNKTYTSGCLPTADVATTVIAPFRTDLNPAAGGTISYAQTTQGFLITYDQVPSFDLLKRYSFQVLLIPDGTIRFIYGTLAALPADLAVGIQPTYLDAFPIGCGATTPITAHMSIEFRAQPDTRFWLATAAFTGTLQPGAHIIAALPVHWVLSTNQPLRGTLRITSNDPAKSTVRVPINVRMLLPLSLLRCPYVGF